MSFEKLTARLFLLLICVHAFAQQQSEFEKRFHAIMSRPEYKHARFGVEFYSLDEGKVIYAWNPDELFVPGSTTKILTVGTALELLGPDFRFHTKIYRTGPVVDGTVHGDLVLVASGDPDLSNRIQADGTMSFENEDHSYDGFAAAKAVPGDPLAVIKELATKVAASGIKKVQGRVLVDIALFPEGDRELGTGVVLSPVVVNDNLVDVTVTPGAREGDKGVLSISPQTRYVSIRNDVKTGAAGSKMDLDWKDDIAAADGTHTVTLTGSIAADAKPKLRVYRVPVPSKFAEITLTEALQNAGVRVEGGATTPTEREQVAEHVSPPLREEARVTLKVSQNPQPCRAMARAAPLCIRPTSWFGSCCISPSSRSPPISKELYRFWAKMERWWKSRWTLRRLAIYSPRLALMQPGTHCRAEGLSRAKG
jgi:D-alanyl-D-alanine carboxypeptidase/D-alanyl-D-alanine-endopeptidase (penicillin-binding protein 4)